METNTEPTCREMGWKDMGRGGGLQPEAKLEGKEVLSQLPTLVARVHYLL